MRISKGMVDEVFVVREQHLLVRVAALLDALNSQPDIEPGWCATEQLCAMRRSDRIDAATVTNMTEQRRDEPVIVAWLQEPYVVDGNHRLERRRGDGFERTRVIAVPSELLVEFLEELGF